MKKNPLVPIVVAAIIAVMLFAGIHSARKNRAAGSEMRPQAPRKLRGDDVGIGQHDQFVFIQIVALGDDVELMLQLHQHARCPLLRSAGRARGAQIAIG